LLTDTYTKWPTKPDTLANPKPHNDEHVHVQHKIG